MQGSGLQGLWWNRELGMRQVWTEVGSREGRQGTTSRSGWHSSEASHWFVPWPSVLEFSIRVGLSASITVTSDNVILLTFPVQLVLDSCDSDRSHATGSVKRYPYGPWGHGEFFAGWFFLTLVWGRQICRRGKKKSSRKPTIAEKQKNAFWAWWRRASFWHHSLFLNFAMRPDVQ